MALLSCWLFVMIFCRRWRGITSRAHWLRAQYSDSVVDSVLHRRYDDFHDIGESFMNMMYPYLEYPWSFQSCVKDAST